MKAGFRHGDNCADGGDRVRRSATPRPRARPTAPARKSRSRQRRGRGGLTGCIAFHSGKGPKGLFAFRARSQFGDACAAPHPAAATFSPQAGRRVAATLPLPLLPVHAGEGAKGRMSGANSFSIRPRDARRPSAFHLHNLATMASRLPDRRIAMPRTPLSACCPRCSWWRRRRRRTAAEGLADALSDLLRSDDANAQPARRAVRPARIAAFLRAAGARRSRRPWSASTPRRRWWRARASPATLLSSSSAASRCRRACSRRWARACWSMRAAMS